MKIKKNTKTMADSKYISIPTSDSLNSPYNTPSKSAKEDTDVITLNILTMQYNNDNNSSISMSTPQTYQTTTTPITTTSSSTTKRLFSRKPKNLHLKISSSPTEEETTIENDNLSSDKSKITSITNNSTSSTTPSTSTTTITTTNSIFPHEQNRTSKKLNIGFENIRYTARMGFFRRGK